MKSAHNLIIDIVALVVYLMAANPAITGLAIHEWLSLGLVVVFFVHCLVHVDWIADTIKRHKTNASTANLALDLATLIVFMVVTVSGLMISRHILPAMGLVAPGYFFWSPLHFISAKLLLALLLIHVVAHWKWFTKLFGRK